MERIIRYAPRIRGEIHVPGDKSVSHRAVIIGALSEGRSEIKGFLMAADPLSTLHCVQALGVEATFAGDVLSIMGKGLRGFRPPLKTLDAGNSGTTIRILSGVLAGQKFPSQISGDRYLIRRPMRRVIEPLAAMGARIEGRNGSTAPLKFSPVDHLNAITYRMPLASAQVKSAILLAGLYANGLTTVIEPQQTRDHTERMLGLESHSLNGEFLVSIEGGKSPHGREFTIPGDPSSAAFLVVAALITADSEIIIRNVGLNKTRVAYLSVLKKMGGQIVIRNTKEIGGEVLGDIEVRSSTLHADLTLAGSDISGMIDEIPILSIAGAFSTGTFELRDARELRVKESDRISSICRNLTAMGVSVEEKPDGFAFEGKNRLIPAKFDSFGDHRVAMAFGVAGLALEGESRMANSECVDISYPKFWDVLNSLTSS